MSDEYKKKQAQLMTETVSNKTYNLYSSYSWKKAPVLITEDMVSSMIPGSVVIDLAVKLVVIAL